MPGFDWVKYIVHVAIIGVFGGALYYFFDTLAPGFNSLVAGGMVAPIGVQCMDILRYAVLAYVPVCFLFASAEAILVGNARAEMNSPLITTDIMPTIGLAFTIVVALILNLFVCALLDPIVIGVTMIPIPESSPLYVPRLIGYMFSLAHLGSVFMVAIAYAYRMLTSLRVESLEWAATGA